MQDIDRLITLFNQLPDHVKREYEYKLLAKEREKHLETRAKLNVLALLLKWVVAGDVDREKITIKTIEDVYGGKFCGTKCNCRESEKS